MPDSAVAALRQLMGFGDNPNMAVLSAAQPSSDMMSPYMNDPSMVSNDPGMQTPAMGNTMQAGAPPSNMLPASPPMPPVRPDGLLSAAPDDDDDDSPAPGAVPAGPAPMPAAPVAPPAPAAPAPAMAAPQSAAPPPAPQSPGTTGSPPDMMAMYKELLDKNERKANFDSGMALIAGGLSGSPEGRAALYNMAGQGGSASAQNQTANTINTLMQLRQFSQKQQATTQQQSRIPAIAAKLGISEQAASYLDATGKLDDLVLKSAEPNTEIKTLNDGRTVLINKTNSQVVADYGGQKDDDKQPKQLALLAGMKENWQNIPGVPDPTSTEPAAQQWWKDQATRILGGGNGTTVNVGTPEKAELQAYGTKVGGAKGDEVAEYIKDGKTAQDTISSLDTMTGALAASKGQYTGPFADYVLKGKQGLAGTFGLDLNLSGQETAQKLGFQLGTQMTKAISARPAQAEFIRSLDNVPGILQTPQGAKALISINKQYAQEKMDLANLAHNIKPGENMNEVAEQYHKSHPIMSPFHPGEAFGQPDMNILATDAANNGVEGAGNIIKPTPSADAIARLKAHPEKQAAFDEHFGTGTSFHYLHGAGAQ